MCILLYITKKIEKEIDVFNFRIDPLFIYDTLKLTNMKQLQTISFIIFHSNRGILSYKILFFFATPLNFQLQFGDLQWFLFLKHVLQTTELHVWTVVCLKLHHVLLKDRKCQILSASTKFPFSKRFISPLFL